MRLRASQETARVHSGVHAQSAASRFRARVDIRSEFACRTYADLEPLREPLNAGIVEIILRIHFAAA